ncbi:MAG TPA: cupin domain-containing protein [Saprospiraceae bacterium]|nr:cupin domain-containing protein [Saprospiraceae bacterium]
MQNNTFTNINDIPEKELVPGIYARLVHMKGMSVARVRIEKDAVLPEHAHVHEQVTNLLSGQLEMTVGDETKVCKAGDVVIIPSKVSHSAKALTECELIDVFQPVREDYK